MTGKSLPLIKKELEIYTNLNKRSYCGKASELRDDIVNKLTLHESYIGQVIDMLPRDIAVQVIREKPHYIKNIENPEDFLIFAAFYQDNSIQQYFPNPNKKIKKLFEVNNDISKYPRLSELKEED